MLTQGKRIMLAAIIASAIGLSCAGCLAPTSLNTAQTIDTAPRQAVYQMAEADNTGLVYLSENPYANGNRTYVAGPEHQYQQNIQYYSNYGPVYEEPIRLTRPRGTVSGIDIAVAEFAQANSADHSSPLNYDRQWRKYDTQRIDAEYTFVANSQSTGLGLDLSLSPRVTIDTKGDVRSTRAGAEVRVGANLDLRGQDAKNPSWYFFAGADGEAVVWDARRGATALTDGQITLQDKVTVGDIQAGIGFESPAGNMSVSYIQREYEYRNGSISRSGDEDFVALTLTWRH